MSEFLKLSYTIEETEDDYYLIDGVTRVRGFGNLSELIYASVAHRLAEAYNRSRNKSNAEKPAIEESEK